MQLKSQVSQKAKHAKIYKSGIRPVSSDLYDCQQTDGLHQYSSRTFKTALARWDGPRGSSVSRSSQVKMASEEALIENFGKLTRLEQVMMSQHLYIDDQVDLHRTRKCCRNSYMCLMASLTSEAKKKVSIWSNQYRIGKNNEGSSVALHKVIIRDSHLDAKAKTNQVRT